METREFKVIVNVPGRAEEVYEFDTCEIKGAYKGSFATIFACGYAEGLMHHMSLNCPMVHSMDGYKWWDGKGNIIVKVVDKDGNIYAPYRVEQI